MKRLYPIYLRGLDESRAVRLECLRGLREIFLPWKTAKDGSLMESDLEEMGRVILLHATDGDAAIASEAVETLKCGRILLEDIFVKLMRKENLSNKTSMYSNLLRELTAFCQESGDK